VNRAEHFDLIIVGGGMVGAAMACAMGDRELKVALIEGRVPDLSWPKAAYENRVSAITRASQYVFENLNAWPQMVNRRVSAYRKMEVWDSTGGGHIHFDSADIAEPDLGHIIENSVIQAALWERLKQLPSVHCFAPATPKQLQITQQQVSLTLDDGRLLEADLIVGADGGRSWVRQQAGFESKGWSYQQDAVVATVGHELSHQACCWQRFAADGPLAFLPLDEKTCSIVWSTSPEHAEQLLALNEVAFLKALQLSFGDSLGKMCTVGERAAFPLRLAHTTRYTGLRLALIGDAAHSIHPLAGQGVNLGLGDMSSLADTLSAAKIRGENIGDMAVLRRYERARKADNVLMMGAMDGFKRLFSNDQPVLRFARNLGLSVTDRISPIKQLFMQQALGLASNRSSLAKPPSNV